MARYEPFDWYQTPIYYDMIFDEGTNQEAHFLAAIHDRYVSSRGRRVLEPACGSGRLMLALAQRGFAVAGFDASEGMLRYAREQLQRHQVKGDLRHARMEDFSYRQPFDLAHCLVSTFKYLDSERAALNHLRCVAAALKPGGVYVLGLHLSEYDISSCTRERWVAQRDNLRVVCNIQGWPADRKTRTERVRSRLIITRPDQIKRYETNWTFRTYDLPQIRQLIRKATMFEHLATYDFTHDINHPIAFDGEQLDNVLILRKKRQA